MRKLCIRMTIRYIYSKLLFSVELILYYICSINIKTKLYYYEYC